MAAFTSEDFPQRVVIAIDLDCFYVACERILDPSLNGKALGIQQKYILATASYEARALGIGKLQNVKEAKKMCPDLLLINGEDLTYYRRFSRAITRLVKGIVWDRQVERLGMDELFCEVTDMCRAHLQDLASPSTSAASTNQVFFNLSRDRSSTTCGFYYDPISAPSLVIPAPSAAKDAQYSPLFAAAAQLAGHIRQRIHTELGFTTSAGIAHNKILAKLVASLNKPALQTTWNPEIRRWKEEQASFLAGFEARKLQGMGHSICRTIRSHIESKPGAEPSEALTIALIRSECTQENFLSWFGPKAGPKLWGLLYGEDHEPVNPSPEYPLQISVENSHYGITSFKQAIDELGSLALHLLQRLKEDLTEGIDDNPVIAAREDRKGKGRHKSRWAQYPTTLRLTIRQGYDRSRESKSTPFPIDAIDEDQAIDVRAAKLTRGILASLLKKLLKTDSTNVGCRITILNVCAANFTKTKPNQTIASALARRKAQPKEIDLTLLPSDDVEESKPEIPTPAHSEPILIEDEDGDEEEIEREMDDSNPKTRGSYRDSAQEGDDDLVFVGEDRPALFTCKQCGSRLFTFSAAAHRAYHDSEEKKEKGKSARKIKPSKPDFKVKTAKIMPK